MLRKFDKSSIYFFVGALLFFLIIQILIDVNILNSFWNTIIRIGAVMAIVSLGLNLIYGINGQFSLGQWGFYGIGAYTAADITFRWTQQGSSLGLTVVLMIVTLVGIGFIILRNLLSHIRGLDALSGFAIYLVATVGLTFLSIGLGGSLEAPVNSLLSNLPQQTATIVVFFFSVLLGGLMAAEVSFIIGLPILTLGSDYFGIATLGFTIIIKVLLDNSDTLFGFPEMKGARGMIGIPKVTSWFWVFIFLLVTVVVTRNLLQSSYGRAIISVREDEIAAKSMGIDVAFYKTLTFVIGSLFAGIAGGLYAHVNGFLHPNSFNFIKSFDPMIIIVFGGLGSITGTVFASFAWALGLEGFLRLFLPEGFETWRFVVYPILLIIMMLLKPKGLFGDYEIPFLRHILPSSRKKNDKGLKSDTSSPQESQL